MIHEVTMYQAQCDRCGKIEDDYGDFAALSDPAHAIDAAIETGHWRQSDADSDRLLCDDCWQWSEDEMDIVEKPPLGAAS